MIVKPENKKKIIAKATPVHEIPQGRKLTKIPEYDAVFQQIIDSPDKMFKIEVEGKTVKTTYAPFSFRVKTYNKKPERKFNLVLKVRSREVYIVKSDRNE
jgi:hypothetical protein